MEDNDLIDTKINDIKNEIASKVKRGYNLSDSELLFILLSDIRDLLYRELDKAL